MQTAIQLYSLRTLDAPVTDIIDEVAETRLDGVEFAGIAEESARSVREALDVGALEPAGAHIPIETIEDDLPAEASDCQLLGVETLIVPILDESRFADTDAVDETASLLSEVATTCDDYDLRVGYHNHDFEFTEMEGQTAFERLIEATDDVTFELDVGWAHVAGGDPLGILDRYGDRISHVHLKDVKADDGAERGGRPVGLGAGDVPLRECAAAAREADVEWAVFEHDDPDDPLAFLEQANEWVAEEL